jgi:predicted transcriptional regulator
MKKLPMGQLEAAVMDVLWDRGGWMTPREVHTELSVHHPVGYTTVMTILVRLWRKGRLDRERDGRAFAYAAVESREAHAAGEMTRFLGAAGNRSAALGHFLQAMSNEERAQLRRLLATRKKR